MPSAIKGVFSAIGSIISGITDFLFGWLSPDLPDPPQPYKQPGRALSISAASNAVRRNEPAAFVCGEFKMVPDGLSQPYKLMVKTKIGLGSISDFADDDNDTVAPSFAAFLNPTFGTLPPANHISLYSRFRRMVAQNLGGAIRPIELPADGSAMEVIVQAFHFGVNRDLIITDPRIKDTPISDYPAVSLAKPGNQRHTQGLLSPDLDSQYTSPVYRYDFASDTFPLVPYFSGDTTAKPVKDYDIAASGSLGGRKPEVNFNAETKEGAPMHSAALMTDDPNVYLNEFTWRAYQLPRKDGFFVARFTHSHIAHHRNTTNLRRQIRKFGETVWRNEPNIRTPDSTPDEFYLVSEVTADDDFIRFNHDSDPREVRLHSWQFVPKEQSIVRYFKGLYRNAIINIRGRLYRTNTSGGYETANIEVNMLLVSENGVAHHTLVNLYNSDPESFGMSLFLKYIQSTASSHNFLILNRSDLEKIIVYSPNATTDDRHNRTRLDVESITVFRNLPDTHPEAYHNAVGMFAAAHHTLSGRLDNFTALVKRSNIPRPLPLDNSRITHSHNPNTPGEHQNPALLFYDFCRGRRQIKPSAGNYPGSEFVYGLGLPDDEIDIAAIMDWYYHCRNNALGCNAVLQEESTAEELLSRIAAAGEGFLSLASGKVGVGFDRDTSQAVAAKFDADNIIQNSFSINYPTRPSIRQFSASFYNAADDYTQKELLEDVPDAPDNGEIRQLTVWGITNEAQCRRALRRAVGDIVYRGREIKFTAAAAGFALAPGDAIEITHDAAGLENFRAKISEIRHNQNGQFAITAREDNAAFYDYVRTGNHA